MLSSRPVTPLVSTLKRIHQRFNFEEEKQKKNLERFISSFGIDV